MASEDVELADDEIASIGDEDGSASEVEQEVETGGEEKEPAGDETPAEIPVELLDVAERCGLGEEALTALGPQLEPTLQGLAREYAAIDRERAEMGQRSRVAGAAARKGPEEAAKETAEAVEGELNFQLDPDLHDETLVGFAKGVQGTVNEMRREMTQLREALAAGEERRDIQTLDTYLAGLGDDHVGLFGKGGTLDLKEGSAALEARRELVNLADGILSSYRRAGRTLDFAGALKKASGSLTSERQEGVARRKVAENVIRRSRQIISRPTQRRTVEKMESPTAKAEKSAAAKMKEIGMTED